MAHWTLGCDAADPHAIAAFWALALGYVAEAGHDEPAWDMAVRERLIREKLTELVAAGATSSASPERA